MDGNSTRRWGTRGTVGNSFSFNFQGTVPPPLCNLSLVPIDARFLKPRMNRGLYVKMAEAPGKVYPYTGGCWDEVS